MFRRRSRLSLLKALFSIFIEVTFFWQLRLYAWWMRKSPRDILQETLADARQYEEWEAAAFQLDEEVGYDLWRQNPTSKHYDYRLIYDRLQAIIAAVDEDDILTLLNILRSGLVRNLGNITTEALFNRAYAGTKLLIEHYVTQVALAVKHFVEYDTSPGGDSGMTNQIKLDVLHDTRQAFGRSALVLQGGAVFGLCHLGVIKALYLRGLLPRIIVGTAAGASIAALVATHAEDELLDIPNKIAEYLSKAGQSNSGSIGLVSYLVPDAVEKVRAVLDQGIFLDVNALERCIVETIGDMTFEEAYNKTKRILNITIGASGSNGMPNALNYLTAPTVLIRSAVSASNNTDPSAIVTLLCHDENGSIVPWASAAGTGLRTSTTTHQQNERESPLARISELFNVNHFIVSQARPYLAPFLRSDLHHSNPRQDTQWGLTWPIFKLVAMEVQHRLHQLDSLGLLPPSSRRFLVDEAMPGASLTLVPELSAQDLLQLLEPASQESVKYWILKGERSVWPAVPALKVRCAIEVELDRGYQLVRRRKPFDAGTPVRVQNNKPQWVRERAKSVGEA